jgi:hypothetical protein
LISYVELGTIADVKGGKRLPKGINLIAEPNSHPYIRVRDLNNAIFASLSQEYEHVDDETQKLISRYVVSTNSFPNHRTDHQYPVRSCYEYTRQGVAVEYLPEKPKPEHRPAEASA